MVSLTWTLQLTGLPVFFLVLLLRNILSWAHRMICHLSDHVPYLLKSSKVFVWLKVKTKVLIRGQTTLCNSTLTLPPHYFSGPIYYLSPLPPFSAIPQISQFFQLRTFAPVVPPAGLPIPRLTYIKTVSFELHHILFVLMPRRCIRPLPSSTSLLKHQFSGRPEKSISVANPTLSFPYTLHQLTHLI